jgi:hypothetical protein
VVRADSGFFAQELLQYLESLELRYIVVARLTKWLKREAARVPEWRAQVFLFGAILGRAGHRTVLHLSTAWGGLEKRNSLFDKLLDYEIPTSRKSEFQPHATG